MLRSVVRADLPTGGGETVISINASIGDPRDPNSIWCEQIAQQLGRARGDVMVRIDSPGGCSREALAIYSALEAYPHAVHVKIERRALSSASLIAMAGDHIEIDHRGLLLIHSAWSYSFYGEQFGSAATEIDRVNTTFAEIYAAKSGRTAADELSRISSGGDLFYTAQHALQQGYVHSISESTMEKGGR